MLGQQKQQKAKLFINSTVGHTGIYACGDRVKLKLLQQCSGHRIKNPMTLVVRSAKPKAHTAILHC